MGLFSLFKRNTPTAPVPSRLADDGEAQRRQRDIARATALKIDAIESDMSFDIFNTPEPAWRSAPAHLGDTQPDDNDPFADEELPALAPQTAPVVEEIAILFANQQTAVAQQMLLASLADERTLWWMLFDLYQVTGQQEPFDDLSIDYASKFETSPPAWVAPAPPAAGAAFAGIMPTLALVGILDAGIAPQLERWHLLAAAHPVLRVELGRITAVEPAGCALLLQSLKALQQQCELVVVAALDLATRIRAVIRVGRRDDTEAPWLLLLELLQLLKREKEFEETSMDYCVTFEVSPPAFIAPGKVAIAAPQPASAAPDRFMLPLVIEGNTDALLAAVNAYPPPTIVFDCSRLVRIDFGAAGRLLSCLQALARQGRKIEFRDVNHLVAALLRLLAFSDIASIYPHKY